MLDLPLTQERPAAGNSVAHHSGVNLKLLRAFLAVSKYGSFTRAAADLGRSQATVSIQVRELEGLLEVKLLERTTRRVKLTEAGTRLADELETGLWHIDQGLADARALSATRRNSIVFACVPSLAGPRIADILTSYKFPSGGVRLSVEELRSTDMIAALAEDRIDFGVGPCPEPQPPEVSFVPSISEQICVVLPPGHKQIGSAGFAVRDLANLPLITLSGAALLHRTIESAARDAGIKLNSRLEVGEVHTAIAMARAGIGVAIVPRLAIPARSDDDGTVLPFVGPPITRTIGLLTKAGKRMSSAATSLSRHIIAALVKDSQQQPNLGRRGPVPKLVCSN
jgi:DNA-binding transcriptional LysR family regulator